MTKLTELIKQVKELDEKATPGPWEWTPDAGKNIFENKYCSLFSTADSDKKDEQDREVISSCDGCRDLGSKENSELIAHYRTACPKLAMACEVMMEALDSAESALIYFETMKDLKSDCEFARDKRKKITLALAEVEKIMEEKE